MPVVQPAPPRYTVDEKEGEITITLPSKRYWFYFPFYLLWFFIAILIAGAPLYFLTGIVWVSLFRGASSSGANSSALLMLALFLFGFFLCWLILFVTGGYSILWRVAGKEIIKIRSDSLALQRQLFGFKREREYIAHEIRDLRVYLDGSGCWKCLDLKAALRQFLKQDGQIAFDYGAMTVQFANDISEAEAKQILAKIRRFPAYAKRSDG